MLERVRATALALLGATAAVGLAIAAIAANQGWPLLEGSAIPAVPKEHVGEASVVARSAPAAPVRSAAGERHGREPAGRGVRHAGGPAHAVAHPAPSSGGQGAPTLTVAEKSPARSPGADAPKTPPARGKGHSSPSQPSQPVASQPPAAPASSPPAEEPAATPTSVPAPAPPQATAAEAPPEESNVPSWSDGHGHAYGRGDGRPDDGSNAYRDDDHGWDSHGYGH